MDHSRKRVKNIWVRALNPVYDVWLSSRRLTQDNGNKMSQLSPLARIALCARMLLASFVIVQLLRDRNFSY